MGKQDVGDLETIRVGIEAWLQAALPDRRGLQIADLSFPEASGESSVTLLLDGKYSDGTEERFVLRMAPPTSQVFEKHDLLMQFQMMELMKTEGIPAPPLIGYESDPKILGADFYVMGFTEGKIPPDNPPFAISSWVKDELTDDERTAMWRNGLEALASIHKIDIDQHGLSRLPRANPGEPLVAEEVRTFDSMFKPELRAAADPRILEGWDFLRGSMPMEGQVGLCWGDSRVGNVIFSDLVPVAIIDWEMANVADPLSDLTWWIWIDRCNSEGLGFPRLGGLPAPEEVYAQWHQLTGRSIENVAWFELFTVVRFAIILERKFTALRELNPDMDTPQNYPAQFIPDLMNAARRRA